MNQLDENELEAEMEELVEEFIQQNRLSIYTDSLWKSMGLIGSIAFFVVLVAYSVISGGWWNILALTTLTILTTMHYVQRVKIDLKADMRQDQAILLGCHKLIKAHLGEDKNANTRETDV